MNRTLTNLVLVLALYFCLPDRLSAQLGEIYGYTLNTAVGNYQFGNNVPATQALLSFPQKVAIDSQGAVYIADSTNNLVRKVVAGQIAIIAGTGIPGFSGDGQAAINAQLNSPCGVAVDAAGNVYIYDSGNYVIRKVDATGNIATIAGTPGAIGSAGDGGPATQALLSLSLGGNVALDSAGNVYFSDYSNSVVRKITVSTHIISSFAGINGQPGSGGDGGPATSANLQTPAGLAFDSAGDLYIADPNNSVIRKVSAATGKISTVAGAAGQFGNAGNGGPAASATLSGPTDVAVDAAGNLYIADTGNSEIRVVSAAATSLITTVAGSGAFGFSGDGGAATAALLSYVSGVGVDSSGTVYIVDTNNNRIRITRGGVIGEFAGADHAQGDGGKATAALLYFPLGIAWDTKGNFYIADSRNNKIRKVTPDGNINTIAGTGSYVPSGDGGPAVAAGVNQPAAVAVDSTGNVYIATLNQVRMIDGNGNISTVVNTAGAAGFTGDGAAATAAELYNPIALALDSANNLYIADTYNHRIRKVSGGNISTVAGSGPTYPVFGGFTGDGGAATSAGLSFPRGVAFDTLGNMLIADNGNQRIRSVNAKSGIISTIAGSANPGGYSGDLGPATSALLFNPIGVAADNAGNIYITDAGNQVVRVVDAFGIISTIAGNNTLGSGGNGGPAIAAEFNVPWGIAPDSSGNVWVTDSNNHRVLKLTPSGPLVGNGPIGIVNAASFASGGLVPGGMATLFGSDLTSGKGINLASGLPLATQLLNASIKINNTLSAPIFAVDNVNGQQQINFQAPWELAGKPSAVVQVLNNGALSLPVTVPVLAAQPAVFAYNVGATTYGVVLHANFQLADSAHPVVAGETVLIYCTNLGAVAPTLADGAPGTGAEITVATPTSTIGGKNAPVSFHGTAPGFVGLYQVNVQIPTGLASGNQPLAIAISGVSSPLVQLPVK